MIRRLTSLIPFYLQIRDLTSGSFCCDPVRMTEEETLQSLERILAKPDTMVFGVFRDSRLIGIFTFLYLPEEQYLEMLTGLSCSENAYEEILQYLEENYPRWQTDFVINPANTGWKKTLLQRGAHFYAEQQKMRFSGTQDTIDTDGIEPFSQPYAEQYYAIHDKDLYWTGDKTAAAPERFNIFLAVDHGIVCGYIDVTNCYEENEPFSLLVVPEYRRRGWGRKLLAKAIQSNGSKGMALQVDVDNIPALKLYESAGFVKVPGRNTQAATWQIPPKEHK